MSTYLIIFAAVGSLLAIACVAWAAGAADRIIAKRQRQREVYELRRKAQASWEQTLAYLQSESADRRVGVRGKAPGARRQALSMY